MKKEKYNCPSCDRLLEEEDGEVKQIGQNKHCPVCGEKVHNEAEADNEFAKIEADLKNENKPNK